MEEIIKIAKTSSEFKKTVEQECLRQVRGDYNVALDRLLEIDKQHSIIPTGNKEHFIDLVNSMKIYGEGRMPIIFVPVMESRDPVLINKTVITSSTSDETNLKGYAINSATRTNSGIIMVDRDNEVRVTTQITNSITSNTVRNKVNLLPDDPIDTEDPGNGGETGGGSTCSPPYYYPGYIIDNYGNLSYYSCINEEFAWANDVWVLGYEEEELSPDNQVASPNDVEAWTTTSRYEGIKEYGGHIQVLDLGQIESWVNGKPEFKYFVYNSTGTLIKEHAFGKWRRSHFRNQQWFAIGGDLIGYWNTSTWGPITYERWIEEDGGSSIALNYTISYTINGVSYSSTISSPARSRDEDLGLANVQFTDPSFFIPLANTPSNRTIYTLNFMNMQREHY